MEELFVGLSLNQVNILIASIIADGEITKTYPGSRRKNNSYREHYSLAQLGYREWKAKMLPDLLYLRTSKDYLVSKSNSFFTRLYPHFYNKGGQKQVPKELLAHCVLPEFIAVLYLDDGSLCINKRISVHKKQIYLSPHICLYLQSFPLSDLQIIQKHIYEAFDIHLRLSKRKDGYGYILKITTVKETLKFLSLIEAVTEECNMEYKSNWNKRFEKERANLKEVYPDFQIISSDSERWRNYTDEEINTIIELKRIKITDTDIAEKVNRSYWSIVYKLRELRKDGRLE